ncbi:SprT-like domain-containing protein [Psychroflexus tropicus]|uniref:SprT-like domain-containing protein n=1 Tax=Psychroflexus tropicus TaxID=197345 RepID=UPI00037F0EFE|nr:SprT-like domain-containing protein [Psychroflexus tropicus]
MKQTLQRYLPVRAVVPVMGMIKAYQIQLKIVSQRQTKHGDYRMKAEGHHQISINSNLNKYRFLITTVHEVAHLVAFKTFGFSILPHGKEWKHTFQKLMLPFLNPEIFPSDLLPELARHFKNPTASSDTDARLSVALKQYDLPNEKNFIFEIPHGSIFQIQNGRKFKKGKRIRKRYECQELSTGKIYVFQPNAEVDLLK